MPLDPEPLPWVARNLVAFNETTNGGHVVTVDDIDCGRPWVWRDGGATFYRSHFSTCPAAHVFRRAAAAPAVEDVPQQSFDLTVPS